jgi:hypothetical protein
MITKEIRVARVGSQHIHAFVSRRLAQSEYRSAAAGAPERNEWAP